MIRVVHPRSRIRMLTFYPSRIRDPGSRGQKGTGSRIPANHPPPPEYLHCEKSLFVLASRQNIPALRTEIPAVDTRTICLLPIEFFLNCPCQKSYGRKFPARNNRYGWKIPAFWCQKGKARKSRQVTTDTAGKFGCQ
jgi:hypothetical protein